MAYLDDDSNIPDDQRQRQLLAARLTAQAAAEGPQGRRLGLYATNTPIIPDRQPGPGAAPDVGAPVAPIPASGASLGGEVPSVKPLNRAEKLALPTVSPGAPAGSSAYYRNEAERLGEKQQWDPSEHGFLGRLGHYAAKVGNIAGDVLSPGTMAIIPGTDLNTQLQKHGAEKAAGAAELRETQEGEAQARGAAETSRAATEAQKEKFAEEEAGKPKPKEEDWKELAGFEGPNGQPLEIEANSGQVRIAGGDITGIKRSAPKPEKENDFDQYYSGLVKAGTPDTPENRLKAHRDWEVQGGKPPQGSWMPLYDKDGQVTGSWNPMNGEVRKAPPNLPGTTTGGATISSKAETAQEKKTAPLRAIIEEADKAQTLKDMADKGNAEADVDLALTFFKTMRSAVSGGSGIRFTQQENNLIMGARSLWDSLEVKGNKIFSHGEPLSAEQRQQILDVINVHRAAAQRQLDEAAKPTKQAPAASSGTPAPTRFGDWKKSQTPAATQP